MFPFQNQGNAPNFSNKPPQTIDGRVESLEKEVSSLKELNIKLVNDLNSIMGWCSQLFAAHQQQKQQIEYLTQVVSYLHQQTVKTPPNTIITNIPDSNSPPHTENVSPTTQQPAPFQKQPAITPEYTPKQRGEDRGYRPKERNQDNRERGEYRDRNAERNNEQRSTDAKPQGNRKGPPPPRGNPPVLNHLATSTDQPCRGWFSASELTSETNTTLPPNAAVVIGPAPSPTPQTPQPAPANPQPAIPVQTTEPTPSPAPSPAASLRSQVTQVLDLFPDAPPHIIEKDLRQTKSVDATVARILEGSLTWQGKQF